MLTRIGMIYQSKILANSSCSATASKYIGFGIRVPNIRDLSIYSRFGNY